MINNDNGDNNNNNDNNNDNDNDDLISVYLLRNIVLLCIASRDAGSIHNCQKCRPKGLQLSVVSGYTDV